MFPSTSKEIKGNLVLEQMEKEAAGETDFFRDDCNVFQVANRHSLDEDPFFFDGNLIAGEADEDAGSADDDFCTFFFQFSVFSFSLLYNPAVFFF